VEQLGAGSRTERVQAGPQAVLKLLKVQRSDASTRRLRTGVQFIVRTDAFEGRDPANPYVGMFQVP
jgi:hypothetical protein